MIRMRKLSTEKRAAILSALVEGMSVTATARLFACSKISVLRLLVDAGSLAAEHHDLMVRRVASKRVQSDEVWSFCGCKAKAKAAGARGDGDVWVWIASDADTKLVISYLVGQRDSDHAHTLMHDLAERVDGRIQLSTDGLSTYVAAVESAFGGAIDYAMAIKTFAAETQGQGRYSPPRCTGCEKHAVSGNPDQAHISTSYAERQNLSLRMGSRRFTRLTNAYSKRLENHEAAVHLHYLHFNFMRKHATLKMTPAVAAGITSKPMTMLDFVHMLEREEKVRGGRLMDYLPAMAS